MQTRLCQRKRASKSKVSQVLELTILPLLTIPPHFEVFEVISDLKTDLEHSKTTLEETKEI